MKKKVGFIIVLGLAALLYGAYILFGSDVINAYNLRAAEQAAESGDHARAAGLYAKILERTPRDETLRLLVCDLYVEAGNFSRAEHTLLSGLKDAGAGAALYIRLSALFTAQDKLYDAVELLDGLRGSPVGDEIEAIRPAPPVFSLPGGVYEERVEVSLTAGEDCLIYLSLTGDYPSTATGLYTEPISLGQGATRLSAVAVNPGGLASSRAEAEYLLENIDDPVVFADPAVEALVRETIGIPEGQVFTSDLRDVEELIFEEAADYRTLDDLRHFSRLTTLKLLGIHNPCDISALSGLEGLSVLSLDSMGLDSVMLDRLAPCVSITQLYLPNNGIGFVTPLSGLTGLTVLDLSSNSVLELSPLSGMSALHTLNLSQNAVEDLSPLSSLSALRTLRLDRNRVQSLKGLEGLTRLELLDVSYNRRLNSIAETSGLTALTALYASNCQIGDLPSLSRLTSLRELSLSSNGISKLEGLGGLSALRTLDLSRNSIEFLSGLGGLVSLETLNLSNNNISSTEPLRGLPALVTLSVENNRLQTLAPLKGCPALKSVQAFGNRITDAPDTWQGTGVNAVWFRN